MRRRVQSKTLTSTPTRLSEVLFGDHMPANLIMVGAAYQRGCVPISWPSIKRAIELNRNGVRRTSRHSHGVELRSSIRMRSPLRVV